jgi:hypothetical protein
MLRAALALLATVLVTDPIRAAEPKAKETSSSYLDIDVVKDQAYRDDAEADPVKHKLDLYLPKGVKNFPVLVFVHGGAWMSGRKEWYVPVGTLFARNGIGTAVINYRLSGGDKPVKHPDHIHDVARAFAWVHANIGKYGGRADQIFLAGHSAGAHLISLLATDPSYLKAEKLSLSNIHGVMALSGVYVIMPFVPIFHKPFGKDDDICKNASPVNHVKGNHPPFLIAYADGDFPTCDKMSDEFCTKLKDCKCDANLLKVVDRNHFTIMLKLCMGEKDPCTRAMFEFVGKHSDWKAVPRK